MMRSTRFGTIVALFTLVTLEGTLVGCGTGPTETGSESTVSGITETTPFADLTNASEVPAPGASCMCTSCDDSDPADAGFTTVAIGTVEILDPSGIIADGGEVPTFSAMPLRSGGAKKCFEILGEVGRIGEAAVKLKESLEAAKAFAEKVKTNGGFDVVRNGQKLQVFWKNLTSLERSAEYVKAYGGLAAKVAGVVGAVVGLVALIRNGACVRQADLDKLKTEATNAKAQSDAAVKAVQDQLAAEHAGNTEAIATLKKQLDDLKKQQEIAQAALNACNACEGK